ncbi:MAG TPA: Calx-beta domain-containing protein [Steroidobacteraceae bacterium]|nr:Calx-beta domain-containing protein [Steroidobacteraceae bacterium]
MSKPTANLSAMVLLMFVAGTAHCATFTVTNTNDSGGGSLRQAILDAVAAPTVAHDNVVTFNIPGTGVHTIRPLSQLPAIKDLTIDGYTQPGSHENTLARGTDAVLTIEIDGSLAGAGTHGLVNQGAVPGAGVPNVTVRGLVINRFGGAGIHVTGPGGAGFPGYVTVRGCYIGTDASGTVARGNGTGIDLGTDAQAMVGDPAPDFGGNTVPWPAWRNVISGNVGAGVKFDSSDPQSPAFGTVRNAYIGTNAAGTAALGNGGDGVAIGADGGVGSAGFGMFIYLHDNLIAANMGDGIDSMGIGIQAVNNIIGAGSDGSALGNQGNGAYFHGASVGYLNATFTPPGMLGPGISNNAGAGVLIGDTAFADVSGRITANQGLGVDLAPVGPTANDAGDADGGPNEGLNHPVITSATTSGSNPTSRIQGTINSRPNAQIQVLLYLNATCNASGYGEAGRFLSSVSGTTDSGGNGSFDSQLAFPIDTNAYPFVVAQSRRFAESSSLPSTLEVSEYSACFALTGGAPAPAMSISDASKNEGNAGTSTMAFTVSLTAAATSAISVNYATANGTASAGSDYAATNGTLTFAAGETSKTVNVAINGDTAVEADETFAVTLSAVSGATLADASAQATIVNDDVAPPPTMSIADVTVTEGNAPVTATFTVTLSAAAAGAVTVNYATADGTALAGSDYTAASGTLSFAPGETSKSIDVIIGGDTTVESAESFAVNLSAPSGATLADANAQGNIVNDDVAAPGGGGSSGGGSSGGGSGGGGAMDAVLLALLAACLLGARASRLRTRFTAGPTMR